jgi:hypothetical protein
MHPNALLHKVQLERARQKYIVRGELGDGKEEAIAIGAPEQQKAELERHAVELSSSSGEVTGVEDQRMEGKVEQRREIEETTRAEER